MLHELITHVSVADGIAATTWFISPHHILGFTIIVLLDLWRRELRSRRLQVLAD